MPKQELVVGLTGSFASGCTTLAEALSQPRYGFTRFSLSNPLKVRWGEENGRDPDKAPRGELQDMGNMFAEKYGQDILARHAWKEARHAKKSRLAFDGIKREAEVAFFREKYPRFTLVALQCQRDERWARARRVYEDQGLTEKHFNRDDIRDQIEEMKHGQQVALCVDDADIVINNNDHHSKTAALKELGDRVGRYVDLLTRNPPSGPNADEIAMATAYAQAELSGCIKRHVGAAIVDKHGMLLSTGFNENPEVIGRCYQRYGHCRKDDLMARRLEALEGTYCPECGQQLGKVAAPFRCPGCGMSLKAHYFLDHGVRLCHAVHAEERALGRLGRTDLTDSVLYTTTFPCLNCAKLIADTRTRRVVYVEPYPEQESAQFLAENHIEVVPFEGVKARAFHSLFKPYRAVMEEQYRLDAL